MQCALWFGLFISRFNCRFNCSHFLSAMQMFQNTNWLNAFAGGASSRNSLFSPFRVCPSLNNMHLLYASIMLCLQFTFVLTVLYYNWLFMMLGSHSKDIECSVFVCIYRHKICSLSVSGCWVNEWEINYLSFICLDDLSFAVLLTAVLGTMSVFVALKKS